MNSGKQVSDSESEESSESSQDNEESSAAGEPATSDAETKYSYPNTSQDAHTQNNPESKDLTFICTTLCDFAGEEGGDLSFSKDDTLTITGIRKDGWWAAKSADGRQGLVPSTYLKVPEDMKRLIDDLLQLSTSQKRDPWDHVKISLNQAHSLSTALQGFGALPVGFRASTLAALSQNEKFKTGAFIIPKLKDSGLSFEDLHWETASTVKPETTMLEKVIELVAIRQVIQPPPGYNVTSHYVRMCLHDGSKVLSNIHTTKAKWDPKSSKIWTFSSKVTSDSSCVDEGQIFIRSNKISATFGILFELCVAYKKEDGEIAEMSCGWSFMRLLNDSGEPVKSRTKILRVHDCFPFSSNLEGSPAYKGALKQFITRNKQPRMVVSISNLRRSSYQSFGYLPSTLIGPVSTISILAMYRKVISDDLLERTSFDSAEKITSPLFANFPKVFSEPDLVDVLKRKNVCKKEAFRNLFMQTVFLILSCCSLPSYSIGDIDAMTIRKSEINRIIQIFVKENEFTALSPAIEYTPVNISELSSRIM